MRFLSLDVGDKTIGVAVTDALLMTAQGVTTIERIGQRKDADKVIAYIKEYECEKVVMGLPMNLDGSDSVQTQKVRDFKTLLYNKMCASGLKNVEVVFQDERFTTKIAENVLIDADVRRKDRKSVIDKQAAVLILQSYLDWYHNQQRRLKAQEEADNE
ncbi:MAG: Holliday junction resolvase RuvX [Firmicutes bacterium]|nr:Holliday junction resolvase RuvX [Bacillota bacterium]MBQ5798004.1 Holliday junction resolvase RuvX [Bacillota bacterium]MBR6500473.1 Holliday junction resolvase RuvX [Bacillota bacterium]